MGVMPLPHFRTLYVDMTYGVKLQPVPPSLSELGRLHFSTSESKALEKLQRIEKTMAFTAVDFSALPQSSFGRTATSPRVSISPVGRLTFNVLVVKDWMKRDVDGVIVQYDPESNKVAFTGIKGVPAKINPKSIAKLSISKVEKEGEIPQMAISISGFLSKVGYDYKAAGNQGFDMEFDPTIMKPVGSYILNLPKETPAARPSKPRVKKADKVVTTSTAKPVVAAPVDDAELIMEQ